MKVLIAAPSYEGKIYCLPQYIEAINSLDKGGLDVFYLLLDNGEIPFDSLPLNIPYDIIRLFGSTRRLNSREVLAYCYSVIFSYAEGYEFDYLLLLETDVIIPSDGLKKLLETAKTYHGLVVPLVFRKDNMRLQVYHDDMRLWEDKGSDGLFRIKRTPYKINEITKPVFRVGSAAFSCVLIPLDCIKQVKIRWSNIHYNHPDVFFYKMINDLKIPVWCNVEVKCEHLQKPFSKEVPW